MACGRIAFDPLADGAPGGSGDDGATLADACPFSSWGTPMVQGELSTAINDTGGQISADGLAYYYQSSASGSDDQIYVSRRASTQALFGAPQLIAAIDSTSDDSSPSPTADDLEMYFASNRSGMPCIYVTTRPTTSVGWQAPSVLSSLCTGMGTDGPYITPDGLRLYYGTSVTLAWGELMVSTRASRADSFGPGAPVPGLAGGDPRGYPSLSADEREIFFEDHTGTTTQIYHAQRGTPQQAFSGDGQVVELGNAVSDPSLSADSRDLYYSDGGDIRVISRSCL
jgi:hypothetical protein